MAPLKQVHVLIPGTSEYIRSRGKRDFADVMKVRLLKWEVIRVTWWAPGHHGDPCKREAGRSESGKAVW